MKVTVLCCIHQLKHYQSDLDLKITLTFKVKLLNLIKIAITLIDRFD